MAGGRGEPKWGWTFWKPVWVRSLAKGRVNGPATARRYPNPPEAIDLSCFLFFPLFILFLFIPHLHPFKAVYLAVPQSTFGRFVSVFSSPSSSCSSPSYLRRFNSAADLARVLSAEKGWADGQTELADWKIFGVEKKKEETENASLSRPPFYLVIQSVGIWLLFGTEENEIPTAFASAAHSKSFSSSSSRLPQSSSANFYFSFLQLPCSFIFRRIFGWCAVITVLLCCCLC